MSGSRKSTCSFSLVLQEEETVDITKSRIKCSKQKKALKIKEFVWRSKTMRIFTLSFTISKSKTKLHAGDVKTGEMAGLSWLSV